MNQRKKYYAIFHGEGKRTTVLRKNREFVAMGIGSPDYWKWSTRKGAGRMKDKINGNAGQEYCRVEAVYC